MWGNARRSTSRRARKVWRTARATVRTSDRSTRPSHRSTDCCATLPTLSRIHFAVSNLTNDATSFRSAHPTLRLPHTIASCLARIYSGDADGCVPYVGTEEWTRELGFQQLEAWRPWLSGTNHNETCQNCVTAGYVTTYSAGPSHNFTFLTIKGAGHSAFQHSSLMLV